VGRRLALLVALACLVPATAAAARSPKDPTLHKTPADVALARTFLIARPDLPSGFRDTGPDTSGSGSDTLCKGVVQPDLHRLVMTADVSSHDFQRTDSLTGFTQVSTEAGLFQTRGEATESMRWFLALPKSKIESCFAEAVRKGLPKTAKTTGFHLQVAHRTVADLHLDVWEVVVRVQRNGNWIPVDLVVAEYRRGRALETLTAVNVGGGLEQTLMSGVSSRITTRLLHASV
jgi:hypothetical protein